MPDHALSSSASTSLFRRGLKASTYARADVNEFGSRRRDEDEAEADDEAEEAAEDEEEEEEDDDDDEEEEELLPDGADQVSAPGAQLSTVRWKGWRMSSRLCLNILSVALPPVRSFGEEGSEEALGPPDGLLVFRGIGRLCFGAAPPRLPWPPRPPAPLPPAPLPPRHDMGGKSLYNPILKITIFALFSGFCAPPI